MNTTTLRGIFPEPKPVHRRNFVRENIRQLKEMQGYVQDHKITSKSQEIKPAKFKNVPPKVYSFMSARRKGSNDVVSKLPYKSLTKKKQDELRIIHKGVQTERPEDIPKLYETGVLKYPSPSVVAQFKSPTRKTKDHGDATSQNLVKSMQKLDLEDQQNYIKQNIKSIKANKQKKETLDPLQPPPGYQKGVVPKYLQEKKAVKEDAPSTNFESESLSGLVLLPDDERKEYLRVARENYAALIKELNSMPMSNDTLKKRRRKMEIEDELKRLDEVIKIFQKPKVFVKADA